jgi:hypothetical protein
MTTQRYETQTARLYRIGDGVFPMCRFVFGTTERPNAITMEIADYSGTTRICLFPRPTTIEELEQMSDGEIRKRFKENAVLWAGASA